MIKKLKKICLCFIVGVLSLFGAVACNESDEELSIVLVEELYREEVILNQEFDVLDVVENYNEDWDYKITECFWIDNLDDLAYHSITVKNNTKFTQTNPYDVHVVLQVSHKKQSAELEFILDLVVPENDMQTEMITSWSETGVSKRIEGNPKYTFEDEESSVKVSYLGDNNNTDGTNGVNIGSFACDSQDASKTSWDNVVMTFRVYNPQSYDLEMGYLVTQGKTEYNDIGHMQDAVVLKAGEWTQVDWSLRSVGLNWNIFSGGRFQELTIYFKTRIIDATDLVAPYQYSLYIGSMDLADYSPDRFPYLETRTESQIWAESTGDEQDKWIGPNYTKKGTDISRWYTTALSAQLVTYTDEQTKPTADTTSYIEYTTTATALNKGTYTANFLDFNTDRPINADLYRTCQKFNWGDAYFCFWAYNNTPNAVCQIMGMDVNKFGAMVVALPYGEWTYVRVSLKDYCNVTTDVFAGLAYDVKLYVNYSETGCHTEETWKNLSTSLFIDGFTIECNPVIPTYTGYNTWLTDNYTADGSTISKYFPTALSVEEKDADEDTYYVPSFIEYTMTATGAASWQYVGNFLDISADHPIDNDAYAQYKDIDWANAYMTFWLYNGNGTAGETCKILYYKDGYEIENAQLIAELVYGQWTQVTVSLKDVYGIKSDPFATDNYDIKLYVQYTHNGYSASTYEDFKGVMYMTGFEIYSPDENDLMVNNYTQSTKTISRFYDTTLATDVKDFGTVVAPENTAYETYIDYTLTTNVNKGDDTYYANFLNFSAYTETVNTRSVAPIPEYLYEKYKDIEWANAFMSFYLYNDSGLTATLYGTKDTTGLDLSQTNQEQQGEVITTVAPNSWTKVTVSLKKYCNIQSDVIATGNYNIKVWLSVTDTSVEEENLQEKAWSFYTTGVEFYTPDENELLTANLTAATKGMYRFYDTSLNASVGQFGTVSAPTGTAYTSYVDYMLTTNANKGDDTYYANFLNFSAYTDVKNTRSTATIPAYLYEKYKTIDWTNAYLSFWFYNDTDLTATLYGTKDTTGLDLNETNQEQQGEVITSVAAKTWTKVNVSLKDYCGIQSDVIATGNYNIKLWLSVTDTSVEASNLAEKSWSFYMTGFEFVSASDVQ